MANTSTGPTSTCHNYPATSIVALPVGVVFLFSLLFCFVLLLYVLCLLLFLLLLCRLIVVIKHCCGCNYCCCFVAVVCVVVVAIVEYLYCLVSSLFMFLLESILHLPLFHIHYHSSEIIKFFQ